MTALNVYIASDAAHFFTDGGNYDAESLELRHLGGKLFHLPQYGAVLAWSGPASLGSALIPVVEGWGASSLAALCSHLPAIVASLNCGDRYSVIVAGAAVGVATEEGGRTAFLAPGDAVKSIPSAIRFAPDAIRSSGLAMMRDQRSSGVVHGYCLHTEVRSGSLHSEVIERWLKSRI
jgi:hypothetical protein